MQDIKQAVPMKRIILLLLFIKLTTVSLCYGQKKGDRDTLQSWMSTFYSIGNLTVSDDGRFVAVHKMYKTNIDTVLVFDSQKPNVPLDTLIKLNQQKNFLTHGQLLAFGNDRAEWLDLTHHKKRVYDHVKRVDVWDGSNQYLIFNENENLSIYNQRGFAIQSFDGVQNYVTDKKSILYLYRNKGSKHEVMSFSKGQCITRYSTENEITKMELTPSGQHLIITEKEPSSSYTINTESEEENITKHTINNETNKQTYVNEGTDKNPFQLKITFINTATGEAIHPEGIPSGNVDFITVTEIQNGKSYLIDFDTRILPAHNEMLEIWYGNDKELRSKKYGTQKHQYYLWYPKTNQSLPLPENLFSAYIPITERYLLAFNTKEEDHYVTPTHFYTLYLYDRQKDSYQRIFNQTFNVIGSPDSRYIIGYDEKDQSWLLYDIETSVLTPVPKKGLGSPVFSKDGHFVFFGSENDLWQMDLKTKRLQSLGIAEGKEIKIINSKKEHSYQQFNAGFEINTIDLQKPLLLKIRDKKNNHTSYIRWKKGKTDVLIQSTANRIKEVKDIPDSKRVFSIEESFNRPPELVVYEGTEMLRRKLYQSGAQDTIAPLLQQDILSYTNSAGKDLKGLLFYPAHFNPAKKYPMVVRIYQKQGESSGIYPIPEFDEDGFNLRLLIENGYFILLPDIVFDSRGTGVSALDCVDTALDVVSTHHNIDQQKIGLTGHSLGGYETNFIATQSNRFAAYVSGSSVSDIVKFYFSYNTHFTIADYSRFENGQFEMDVPFSKDKERYFRNNPIINVEKVNAPILLWAGMKDENVPSDQTMEFYMGLVRNQKRVVALLYQNKEHDLGRGSEESKDLNIKTLEWWDYFLKDKKDTSWIYK